MRRCAGPVSLQRRRMSTICGRSVADARLLAHAGDLLTAFEQDQ